MKAVIIGYGYMGEIRKRVIDTIDRLTLEAICDPNLNSNDTNHDCPIYDDYREVIDKVCPDIVFVCTPNRFSPEVCVYAMERGHHVFCEKPPGRNLQDIRKIIAAEQGAQNVKLMFGFNHRHHPAILEAKALVDAGRMGRIMWLRGVYGKSGGFGSSFESSWRNDPAISGGGILLDQGIHMLDLFRFFCGDFEHVQGLLTTACWDIPVEDNAFVLLRNKQGQIAQLHSSATLWKHTFHIELGLERGYLIAHGLLSKTGSYGRETLIIGRKPATADEAAVGNPREEIIYFDKDLSWDVQVLELLHCIENDCPVVESSSSDALKVMELIDAVYREAGANVELSVASMTAEERS